MDELGFEDLIKGMVVFDIQGDKGIIDDCSDIHNVNVIYDNGGAGLYCFEDACDEHYAKLFSTKPEWTSYVISKQSSTGHHLKQMIDSLVDQEINKAKIIQLEYLLSQYDKYWQHTGMVNIVKNELDNLKGNNATLEQLNNYDICNECFGTGEVRTIWGPAGHSLGMKKCFTCNGTGKIPH